MWQFVWRWQKWQCIAWSEQCQQIWWQILRHFSAVKPLLVFLRFVLIFARINQSMIEILFIYWRTTMQWRPFYLFRFPNTNARPNFKIRQRKEEKNNSLRFIYVAANFQDGVDWEWQFERFDCATRFLIQFWRLLERFAMFEHENEFWIFDSQIYWFHIYI